MSRKYRLGQSREAQDMDHRDTYSRERAADSKRRQRTAERLETGIESHDAEALLRLPDATPWLHLPEATLIQRHSQWVDLELADGSTLCATLGGKLKGVHLVCGDRVRYVPMPQEAMTGNPGSSSAPMPTSSGSAPPWWTHPSARACWSAPRCWPWMRASPSGCSSPSGTGPP
ncbi:MAG: hypothetical protein NTW40_09235 [Acidobacteria bacterium]|nr:hypothetical protein [Acidobacteriota bacterium]